MICRRLSLLLLFVVATGCLVAQNYKIVNANSGLVLEVPNSSGTAGTLVDQYQWNGGANQMWNMIPVGNGWYYLKNVNSGQYLTITSPPNVDGSYIEQWPSGAGVNQYWQVQPQGNSQSWIANYYGKVLNPYGAFTNNGDQIQQWDPLTGTGPGCTAPYSPISCLNQLWEVIPVQESYYSSTQTNLYYNSSNSTVEAVGTVDWDYSSAYYYASSLDTYINVNGNAAGYQRWPSNGGYASGNGQAALTVSVHPGDYVEARTLTSYYQQYLVSQVIPGCGSDCGTYYDPFNYYLVSTTGEGSDIPTFSTTVWAAPIIVLFKTLLRQVGSNTNGNSLTVPNGPHNIFGLKVRSFIPPAWVRGLYPADSCITLNGSGSILGVIYGGDNRGFDPFSMHYRTDSEVAVSAQTGTEVTTAFFGAGTTYRYASDALNPDGYTLTSDNILHDCHYTDNIVQESNGDMHVSVTGGGGTVKANFYGSATNLATSYPPWTPSINWNMTYTISTSSNPYFPDYTVQYTHDCYPAHEAYIGSQLVYGYKPSSNNPVIIGGCLAGLGQVTGTEFGTVGGL